MSPHLTVALTVLASVALAAAVLLGLSAAS
jgi:hypothetical protein